jgi:hypothetical protein
MLLACSRRCGGELFRAVFAEVDLDAGGQYQDHHIAQPGYVCLNCGAPAFDLGVVPAEMEAEALQEVQLAEPSHVLCPVCETMVEVGSDLECPNCGAPLEVA